MNNKKAQKLYKKGLRALKRNKLLHANIAFGRALELQPNNTKILLDKGLLLIKLYRRREALKVFETILTIEPSNKIAQENKNSILQNDNKRKLKESEDEKTIIEEKNGTSDKSTTFLNAKTLAAHFGRNNKERRAVETTYNHFSEFGKYKSLYDAKRDSRGRDIEILSSNPVDIILGLILIGMFFFGSLFPLTIWFIDEVILSESTTNFAITLAVTLYSLFGGIGAILLFFLHKLRYYFIILNAQGIYYKKSSKPQFLAWEDMSQIIATMKYAGRYGAKMPSHVVVRIYLDDNNIVRFNLGHYSLNKDAIIWPVDSSNLRERYVKAYAFAEIFKEFTSRFGYVDCPFYYYDHSRHNFYYPFRD